MGVFRNLLNRIVKKSDFIIIFFIVGCAQSKSNREPDRTSAVSALLSAKLSVVSSTNLEPSAVTDFQTATSEQNKGIIKTVSGPPPFTDLVRELRTGIVGTFEVRLALTPKFVVAHALIPKDIASSLSRMDQVLIQTLEAHIQRNASGMEKMNLDGIAPNMELLPIAQVAVTSAGVLAPTQNEIGENTPILQIIPTVFSQVTHFIMGHMDTRTRMILTNEEVAKEVFLESSISGHITTYGMLRTQTGIKLRLESDAEKLLAERKGNTLNLYRFVQKSNLTSDELAALNAGSSEVLRACSADQSGVVGIPASDCVMVLSFTVPIEVVAAERSKDSEGYETGEVAIRVLTDTEASSGLIQIAQNVEVTEVRPDQVLQTVDERKILRPQNLVGKEYLFRRTLQDSPNTFDYAFAGLSGDLEIVKFEFAESSVKVIRAEALLSAPDNSAVDKEILMEIPAQYVLVSQTAPDGSQLPFESVTPSVYTNPNAIALVDWASNKIPNVSSPLNYFGLENCFNSKTQSVSDVDSRFQVDGMLNFTVTSTYASSSIVDCAGIEMADYFQRLQTIFSFKERISFKEFHEPAVENPTLNIPLLAQKKLGFGLFTYSKKVPNQSGETQLEDTVVNLPSVFDFSNGRTVTYVLAGLPGGSGADAATMEKRNVVVKATERVIADLNNSLRESMKGSPLERSDDYVKLEIEGEGGVAVKTLGDLDRNYIYYVAKTTDSPIIGLGGSHPNPRSGRVEAASVFLYGGNMMQGIARLKRYKAAESFREQIMAAVPLAADGSPVAQAEKINPMGGEISAPSAAGKSQATAKLPSFHKINAKVTAKFNLNDAAKKNVERNGKLIGKLEYVGSKLDRSQVNQKLSPRSLKISQALESIRHDGLYATTSFDNTAKITQRISASLGVNAPNKALVNRIRQADYCVYEARPDFALGSKGIGDESDLELLGKMWTATLAHELGHNFGLRHNFQGSYDKANWSHGEDTTRDYSAIMDYLNNDYETYDGYGPNDVAGFRGAYAEVVEKNDGSMIPIKDIPQMLGHKGWLDISKSEIQSLGVKDYAFCTDEDVGFSPTCQPFDEGTTPLEIVENKIKDYNTRYALSHFPNDRVSFDESFVGNIVGRNMSDFTQMRQFLEESIYQLIQGADVQTVVIPNLQGALRAMEFFQGIIRNPDASTYMDADPYPQDPNSSTSRYLALQVNTDQGPTLLHGEARWLQDVYLDQDQTRLKVVGAELDKVIATIMLTERDFGFSKYEAIQLRLAYPDIEKLVYDAPTPDGLPTVTLLREIMQNRITAQTDTSLGTLDLPAAYQVSATDLMRFYAALGSVANLDVNGLEAADNNSTLFRVFNDMKNPPDGTPFMTRLGATSDLRFWADADNLASLNVVGGGSNLKATIDNGANFKTLVAKLVAATHPDLAVNPDDGKADPVAIRSSLAAEIAKLPAGPNEVTVQDIEDQAANLLDTGAQVDQILASGSDPGFMLQLEQIKNDQRSTQLDTPVMGLAVEALFNDQILASPQGMGMIADSSALVTQYGTMFQNVETSSQIFSELHPEYFR